LLEADDTVARVLRGSPFEDSEYTASDVAPTEHSIATSSRRGTISFSSWHYLGSERVRTIRSVAPVSYTSWCVFKN